MLKLPYKKSDVMLLKNNFRACPTSMGGPRSPCIGRAKI